MQRLRWFGFIPLLCLFMIVTCFPVMAADVYKIGIIGPMQFAQGKGMWNGAEMAADEINATGGIKVGNRKLKIELYKADSNEFISIPTAVSAMQDLVQRDKVNMVTGGFRTEAVLAMQDIAMDNKTLFIGTGAAHPELCARVARDYDRYKYWFRGSPFNSNYLVKASFNQVRSVATHLKKQLEIDRVKVAIVAEKAMWVDSMVKESESFLPKMGMEVVGTWRPAANAQDVSAELAAIQRGGAHIIFTIVSGSVGGPLARQAGEMKLPAVQVGINVEAQKTNFWQETRGMCNYVMTITSYVRGAEINEMTGPFVEEYYNRFGDVPTMTSDTYTVIKSVVDSIEKAGSINNDKIVAHFEDKVTVIPSGLRAYEKDEQGRHLHDVKYGPGFTTGLGFQWQEGKMVAVWPHFKWMAPYFEYSVEPPEKSNELTIKGLQPYVIPPWMLAAFKK